MRVPMQGDLFARGTPALGPLEPRRIQLDAASWLDHGVGWLSGADCLFHTLEATLPWRKESRRMYDRIVEVPRLMASLDQGVMAAHPVLVRLAQALSHRYGCDLGTGFAAYYRDGDDSVAWHNDRVDLTRAEHVGAIVSLGGPRKLMFRAKDRRSPTRTIIMGSGDLIVQGGAIQHHWEHCVPKQRFSHPRMSLMFFGHELERLAGTTSSARVTVAESTRARRSAVVGTGGVKRMEHFSRFARSSVEVGARTGSVR